MNCGPYGVRIWGSIIWQKNIDVELSFVSKGFTLPKRMMTTKDDDYPNLSHEIFYRVLAIPGGAGFLPSTV